MAVVGATPIAEQGGQVKGLEASACKLWSGGHYITAPHPQFCTSPAIGCRHLKCCPVVLPTL